MHFIKIIGIAVTCGAVMLLATTPCLADCVLPEFGSTGTVLLPPEGCTYLSAAQLHAIVNGLPPETDIVVRAIHTEFWNIVRTPDTRLGSGGEKEEFDSTLTLEMTGTGSLSGFNRTINVNVHCVVYTAAHVPGEKIDTEMASLQGSISGDADFDLLEISAGADLGLGSSMGITSFQDAGAGMIRTYSFFFMNYQIYFEGASGGDLAGLSGTTTGTARMGIDPPVPSVSEWGLVVMALVGLVAGTIVFARRRSLKLAAGG